MENMMKQQESSPFITEGKSFEKNYILHGYYICVHHAGTICKNLFFFLSLYYQLYQLTFSESNGLNTSVIFAWLSIKAISKQQNGQRHEMKQNNKTHAAQRMKPSTGDFAWKVWP